MESDMAAIAVALACGGLAVQRFASDQWKQRFGAMGSPLIASPTYRGLFLLVAIGLLFIATLPEASFVLPALDAVGLDIVTVFAAFELRHYLGSAARLVGIPTGVGVYLRGRVQAVRRCADVMWSKPALSLYACMWPVIWLRTHTH